MWTEITPAFKDDYQTLAIDLPHHGKSLNSQASISMQNMAEAVLKVLEEESVKEPVIIGHSMGGYVGLELLRLIPAKLILLHSNFWADSEEKKLDRNRVIEIVQKNKSLFIQEAIPNLFAPANRLKCASSITSLISEAVEIPAAHIAHATAAMRDRRAAYDIIKDADVSIIHGDADPIIPTEMLQKQLNEHGVNCTLKVIENCGHMSIWEEPKALIESINSILIE